MNNVTILEENPISMSELKEELKKIKKRDETLNFRSEKTEEYLNQVVLSDHKDYEDIIKQITELNLLRLKKEHIIKLADNLPKKEEEVKTILQGYNITLKKEDYKKISDVVSGVLT